MALAETRYQFRVTLADVTRGVDAQTVLTLAQHPSETIGRVYLRLLTWAIWYTPRLTAGPGLCEPDEPTFYEDDLTGRRSLWIAVNPARADKVRHAVRHSRGATVAIAFDGLPSLARFRETADGSTELREAEFVVFEEGLVERLAESLDERRYDLSLTIVEDHLYLTAGRQTFEGTFARSRGLPPG